MRLINLNLWRARLEDDYLARAGEYRAEFLATVHEMGYDGPFWRPG